MENTYDKKAEEYGTKESKSFLYILLNEELHNRIIKFRRAISDFLISIKRINIYDLALFCRIMAVLTGAGVSITQSLYITGKQLQNKRLKKATNEVFKLVQEGSSLSKAMSSFSEFPGFLNYMVEAGEASGQLEEVLHSMSLYYEKENRLLKKIRSAFLYPSFTALCAVCVIALLVIKVLPQFAAMFQTMGAKLPGITIALISFSEYIKKYWQFILAFFAFVIYIFKKILSTEGGRYACSSLFLNAPMIGPFMKKVNASRFSNTLSMLLKNGVNIINAMDIVKDSIGNSCAKRGVSICKHNLEQGQSLYMSILSADIFPEMLAGMILVGEESGTLDDTLLRMSEYYEEEVSEAGLRLTSIIEPAVMIVLGIVVCIIIMSTMLPMVEMYSMVK